jgi:hypothetical protein
MKLPKREAELRDDPPDSDNHLCLKRFYSVLQENVHLQARVTRLQEECNRLLAEKRQALLMPEHRVYLLIHESDLDFGCTVYRTREAAGAAAVRLITGMLCELDEQAQARVKETLDAPSKAMEAWERATCGEERFTVKEAEVG